MTSLPGAITSSTDANNQSTTTEYAAYDVLGNANPMQRLTRVNRPDGSWSAYGYSDQPGSLFVLTRTSLDSSRSIDATRYFDGLGRVWRVEQSEGATSIFADTQHDSLGRVWKVSNPYRGGETILWTTSAYDALGRVVSVTTPDGAQVGTAYAGSSSGTLGLTITVTDQALKKRRSLTDALGRLVRVDEPDGNGNLGAVTSPLQPTSYTYDVLDNLSTVSQGVQTRFFMYDSLKRLMRARIPEQNTNSTLNLSDPLTGNSQWSIGYQYDTNGNLTQKTDARAVLSTYAYDALNRNTSVVYTNDPAGTPAVYRYYDGWRAGNFTNIPNVKGRLWQSETSGANGSRTTINSFDALGRPLSQSQQFYSGTGWNQAFTVQRTPYNLAGGVTSQTYPSGRIISYAYDNAGRTNSFTGNLGDGANRTYSTGIIYSPLGGMTKEQFGTDTPLYNKSFYNSRGQLAEIRVGTSYTGPTDTGFERGAIINHYSNQGGCWGAGCNATDNNGNVKKQEHWIKDSNGQVVAINTQQFDYDSLNRIQRVYEGTSWQQEYFYDRYGNRTIHQTNTWETWGPSSGPLIPKPAFEVQTSTNRLYAPGDLALPESQRLMQYDAAGNLKKDAYTGAGDRIYDAENRMTSAGTAGGSPAVYTYNADGQRVRRTVAGQPSAVTTWQVYGMDGELLAEYAANASYATPQKEYGYRNGQLLVTAEAGTENQSIEEVSWTNAVGVTVSGNNLTKTAATGWGNAGAASTQTITSGDGYVETTAGETTTARIVGLSHTDTDQNWASIDYGIDLDMGGTIYVFESGNNRGSFGSYATGDRLRVAIEAGVVKYSKNGTLLYTSTVAPSYPLLADTSIYSQGSTLGNVVIVSGPQSVSWTNAVGVTVSGNNLTKTAATGWGNAGAAATQTITSGDGYVETTAGETTTARIIGFSHTDTDQNWASIDYGIDLDVGGTIYVFESGNNRGSFGSYATGDRLRVAVEGGVVKYRKNGALLYTSTLSPTYPLLVDTALHTIGSTLGNVVLGAGAGISSAQVQWLVADQLGTPRMIFDQTGSLATAKRHDYLPFGEELFAGQGGRTTGQGYVGDNVRQKFTQKERDNETGLDYFGARYYSSTQGRFTGADPYDINIERQMTSDPEEAEDLFRDYIFQPQHWNRYAYALNNPLRYVDPDGRKDEEFEVHNLELLGKTIHVKISKNLDQDTRATILENITAAVSRINEAQDLTPAEIKQINKLNGLKVSTDIRGTAMNKGEGYFEMKPHWVVNQGSVDFLAGGILHDNGHQGQGDPSPDSEAWINNEKKASGKAADVARKIPRFETGVIDWLDADARTGHLANGKLPDSRPPKKKRP